MAAFDGLGTALRLLRVERGLTQVQLAERSGIGKSLISRYEAEVTEPKLESLGRILDSLGSDLGELDEALHRVRRHRNDTGGATAAPPALDPEPRRAFVVFEVQEVTPPVASRAESESRDETSETLENFRSMMRFLLREIPRSKARRASFPETSDAQEMNG